MKIYVQKLDEEHYILVNAEGEMVDCNGVVVREPVIVGGAAAAGYPLYE